MVSLNENTSMAGASLGRVGGGCSRKRKRQEPTPIVESHFIIGQSTHYHPAEEYGDQGNCSEKVFVAAQQSLALNQDVLGVCQQTTVNAHIQAQPAPSALVHTTTKTTKVDCNHDCSEYVDVEQVCFGMVCISNSCCFSPLVIAEC